MKHPGKIEADPLLRQLIGGFSINGGVRAGTDVPHGLVTRNSVRIRPSVEWLPARERTDEQAESYPYPDPSGRKRPGEAGDLHRGHHARHHPQDHHDERRREEQLHPAADLQPKKVECEWDERTVEAECRSQTLPAAGDGDGGAEAKADEEPVGGGAQRWRRR